MADESNPYGFIPTTLQTGEDVNTFLARCPPSKTPHSAGPWIYIVNPRVSRIDGDWSAAFMMLKDQLADAGRVLDEDSMYSHEIKKQYVERLKHSILDAATKANATVGKWMLFPDPRDADAVWARVAHATYKGKLGIKAKIATNNGSGREPVCCVYTYNFGDLEDVKRVLVALDDMGFLKGRTISYKPDIYTYLGLNTGNKTQIHPTIYNSRDMLGGGLSGGNDQNCGPDLIEID